jgi:RHS repeat-associated protein
VINRWDYRIANLDPVVGKTISQIRLYADGTTQPGQWDIYFQDLVFTGADGSIQPLYSQNATVPSLTGFGSTGMTQTSATIHDCVGAGCAPINTTTYYHGDQIGSSRLLTNGTGYPIWQGTFLPFGEEYNAQMTTNHYKFTDKERDSESGLDYFGRRYYASLFGRWTGSDPINFSTKHILRPQRWNKYTYVENDPLGSIDPDGNEDYKVFLAAPEAGGNWDKAKSIAQAYGHTLEVFRGKDATVQNFNAMSMDRDNRVIVVGHTSHLPNSDGTPGATVSINLSNGRSAGLNSVTQQVDNGNVHDVPNPPTLVNADTVALFGCNSIDLSKDFSGASNFVGLNSGTDHLSTFPAMNAAAEAFVEADAAARPAGTANAVSDTTVNASNQAFQNNRAVGDQGVGTDFDGDKVKKDDKQPK